MTADIDNVTRDKKLANRWRGSARRAARLHAIDHAILYVKAGTHHPYSRAVNTGVISGTREHGP